MPASAPRVVSMVDRESSRDARRILLVGFKDAATECTGRELRARGIDVRLVVGPTEAIDAARTWRAHVVCLQLPIQGSDSIGVCAALKGGPAPPGVLLVDSCGQAAAIVDALPPELQPDCIIQPPLDAGRLLVAVGRSLGPRLVAVGGEARDHPGPSFPEFLIELKERRETGVLEVRVAGVRTDVHVYRGDPVLAEGGTIRETLGRLLVRRGELREEDYVRVIQRMTESLVEHEPLRMGEALVELGLMTPTDVYQALVNQVHEKVVACFQWEDPELEFRPVEAMPQEVIAFHCAPSEALVLAGVRAHFDAVRLAPILDAHESQHVAPREDVALLAERWRLSPAEQRFLRAATGERTLAQLVGLASLDALHARQLLAALLMGRALTLSEHRTDTAPRREFPAVLVSASAPAVESAREAELAPGSQGPHSTPNAPAAPSAAEDWAAFMSPVATVAAPKKAPAEATTVVRLEPGGGQSGIRPTDALRRLRNRLVLGKQVPGSTRTQKQAELTAEQAFQRGKQLLRQGVPSAALKELEHALSLRTEEVEYQLYAAWAQSLSGNDADGHTLARARARQIAIQLTHQSRGHPKAHAILGQLLLEEGEAEAAEKHFRIAVQGDPNEIDAERGLRLLTLRKRG